MSDHYLRQGERLMWGGQICRVTRVSDCNATIRPVSAQTHVIEDKLKGTTKTFTTPGRDLLIATATSEELMVKP